MSSPLVVFLLIWKYRNKTTILNKMSLITYLQKNKINNNKQLKFN